MGTDDPPVLTGPISGGKGKPFGSPIDDLAARGYVMEEFLVEGTAGSYAPVPGSEVGIDGWWEVEPAEEAPYRTRMHVVRPVDPAEFNGIVVVNWQNVTAGIDLGMPQREMYRGYAWVGVTTQRVAIEGQPALGAGFAGTDGLPAWDPERYGSLHHPGDAWSYDIFTQAARTVAPGRHPQVVDPLGGLEPRAIIALGGSQSAMRLGSYLNIAHRHAQLFDGFLLTVHWGMCPPPPDQSLMKSFAPRDAGLTAGSARIRDDGSVPVLVVCSESETLNNYPVRQPDTQTFRFWEMAGTAHAGGAGLDAFFGMPDGLDLAGGAPDGMTPNIVSWDYVGDAAVRHIVAWVDKTVTPPSFSAIDVDPGPPATIRRDEWGNATGGMRLPDIEAATGSHRGSNDGSPVAALMGETVAFTPEQLAARYRDRDTYVGVWDHAIHALVAAGLDLAPDLELLRARGRRVADDLFST
jgi:hypothetical protein